MQSISTIISRIEMHCASHGIAESTFGRMAVNDGKFVSRLRSGGSMTLRTFERLESVLSAPATTSTLPPKPSEKSETSSAASANDTEGAK